MNRRAFAFFNRFPGGLALLSLLARLRRLSFPGSAAYWRSRYAHGGTSGTGSRGALAQYKADVVNRFVSEHEVRSVIDFGCGDGYQLLLARYPAYIGLDVSPEAINHCKKLFSGDSSKRFFVYEPGLFNDARTPLHAELAISLDVIYHLVEDDVYEEYLRQLFSAADRYVIVFSSDTDSNPPFLAPHVKHRAFTHRVAVTMPDWHLVEKIPNALADQYYELPELAPHFFVYERCQSHGAMRHR